MMQTSAVNCTDWCHQVNLYPTLGDFVFLFSFFGDEVLYCKALFNFIFFLSLPYVIYKLQNQQTYMRVDAKIKASCASFIRWKMTPIFYTVSRLILLLHVTTAWITTTTTKMWPWHTWQPWQLHSLWRGRQKMVLHCTQADCVHILHGVFSCTNSKRVQKTWWEKRTTLQFEK